MVDAILGDFEQAVSEFRAALPGWWFSVGFCSVSRDASCGPDNAYRSKEERQRFDNGVHVDLEEPGSTLADALREVTQMAAEELREWQRGRA